jgi:hypothetical protein
VFRGKPPVSANLRFKDVPLRRISGARMAGSVSADYLLGQKDMEVTRDRYVGHSSSSSTISGCVDHYQRVIVNAVNTRDVLEDVTIVVQTYAKPASATGRIEPEPLGQLVARLDQVTGERTIVDFAPLSTRRYRDRYVSMHGYSSSYRGGAEFYGAVVTVFDQKGEIAFQGVSSDRLKAVAPATLSQAVEDDRPQPPGPLPFGPGPFPR